MGLQFLLQLGDTKSIGLEAALEALVRIVVPVLLIGYREACQNKLG
jgi:hypothetical protein